MLPPEILKRRQTKLYETIQAAGLAGIALNPSPTQTYLTGLHFHLMERPIVMFFAPGKTPTMIIPELEMRKLDNLPFEMKAFPYSENPAVWGDAFASAIQSAGLMSGKIGVEANFMRFLELNYLKAAAPEVAFTDATQAVAALRMYKDETEIAAMQKAADVAQNALQATLKLIKLGMTEQELSSELVVQLLRHGAGPALPFSPIVSFGPNSANPHATPTQRTLQDGDLLLIDYGAGVDDYLSDITRTFAVGDVEPELRKIAAIVHEANQAAHAASKPGATIASVDQAARGVIEQAGYGKYFTHRTGHGLGMEGHEEPYIRGDNQQILETGMTFTIEPGIYLPERGGVRIEDDVLVTKDGLHSFSDLPRELIQII